MGSLLYQGKIEIITENQEYLNIEEKINHYFENEEEYCAFPIIRAYPDAPSIFFSIPFDNHCQLERFEKEIMKVLSLIEHYGKCKIKDGYINVFELFRVEDPVQYKYILKRKDDGRIAVTKQTFKRDAYIKMKNYLKKSTKENQTFFQSLFPSS